MFRKFVMILCIMYALCICAYADTEVETIDDTTVTQEHEIVNFTEVMVPNGENVFADTESEVVPFEVMSREMHLEELSLRLSQKKNLKKPEEFTSMMKGSPRVVYNNVSEYAAFVCRYDLDDEQLEVVNRILENGTTVQSLIQVYEFWLTTDYDFSMVEEICTLEDNYFSEFWYESAFNYITNNIHGVLNYDDINHYRSLGISNDEIMAANVLCRKQGQNIFDILDGVANGVTIEMQAMEIYGVDSLPENESVYRMALELSKSNVQKMAVFVTDATMAQQANVEKELLNTFVQEKITMETERLNLTEPEVDSSEDYEALLRCHLPLSAQRTLLNKGYTPAEIEQISRIGGWNIMQTAKMVREAQSK